jgi:hypothetical protein
MAEERENRWRKAWGWIQQDPSWAFFLAFVLFGMISLPLARASLVLSLVFSLVDKNVRARFRLTPPGWGWLAYFVLAVVVSGAMAVANSKWGVAHGLMPAVDPYIEPARGFRKLPKLLWYMAIPVTAMQVRDAGRFRSAFRAWIAGGALLALFVILVHPPLAWLQVHCHAGPAWFDKWLSSPLWKPWGGRPPSFQFAFSALGTMHDAQRLMVALIASVCAIVAADGRDSRKRWGVAAIVAVGLVMTCKRGPLLVGIVVSAVVLASRVRWWKIFVLAAIVVLAAFIQPQSRARLLDLPNEFSTNKHLLVKRGGRMLMWTHIVPALHAEYPRGMGFRSLTAIKMHNVDWHVERNRTHVHSVPLQAFVDFGWAGPIVWLFWLFLAFRQTARLRRDGPSAGLLGAEALMPLATLSSLVVFGLVEYNLADAAVVPLYSIAMGLPMLARR